MQCISKHKTKNSRTNTGVIFRNFLKLNPAIHYIFFWISVGSAALRRLTQKISGYQFIRLFISTPRCFAGSGRFDRKYAYRLQKSRFSTLTLWLFCDGAICNSGHQRRFGTRCTGRTDIDFVLSEKTCALK